MKLIYLTIENLFLLSIQIFLIEIVTNFVAFFDFKETF
jgi:hypothetical protein